MKRRRAALMCGLVLLVGTISAQAQRSGVNVAGDFDFYVLSLSWSPSYCQAEGAAAAPLQCGGGRPYAFIVHGLWPQYERGWPEYCTMRPAQAPPDVVRSMLDIMPSEGLVQHQWHKHGTCSGQTPEGYFEMTRRARSSVSIPADLQRLDQAIRVAPGNVADAFRAANPAIPADGIAVTCDRQRLREVRVCLGRDLRFRSCPNVAGRACRLDRAMMPPVR